MALNLSGADKTFRRYAAVEGVNHPPIHPLFVHAPPPGDAVKPGDSTAFTAVAATDLLTSTAHGLLAGTPVRFTSTTTLPGGLSAGTTYYVIASGLTANDFKVSATLGGSAVDVTSTGTGTHYWSRYLTSGEQDEVNGWLARANPGSGSIPTPYLSDAQTAYGALSTNAKITADAWIAYWSNPTHLSWVIDDSLQRHHQWIWRSADHADASQAATPPSASVSGTITTPPPASPANVSPN